MAAQEQPDFLAMAADMNTVAADMNNVARAHASIAINLERMQNVPAFNQGAAILEAIRQGFEEVNNRLDSIEYNSIARHTNGHANHSTTPLTPLRDSRNRDVANFPADLAALINMNAGELNQLLQAYGLPVVGNIGSRRNQFKKFIGVVMTWG
ncbi:hypothetical protein DFP73DRAFT_208468 [Morchella snyderi]|nr:hypothetical protein DFP73DRAFT_208468 [Morchella snyderi]